MTQENKALRSRLKAAESVIVDALTSQPDNDSGCRLHLERPLTHVVALAESVLRKCVAIEKPNLEYPHFNLESFSELPYLHLAEALYYQGKMQEAIQYAQKATELKPDSKMAQLTLEEITRFSKTALPDTSGVKAEQIIVTDD